jgi:nascent polypeptide-associated complex subunit alpha
MTMYPRGVNPKQMERMMRQMGVKVEEIEGVSKVVIFSAKGEIVITNPQVTKTKIMGQVMYQVTGEESASGTSPAKAEAEKQAFSEEDVTLVADQAKTTKEKARKALAESKGDIAEAIISLSQ